MRIKGKALAILVVALLTLPLVLTACTPKNQLPAPKNLKVLNNILYWDGNEHAVGYNVKINNGSATYVDDISQYSLADLATGEYTLQVMAVAATGYKNSKWAKKKFSIVSKSVLIIANEGESDALKEMIKSDMGYRTVVTAPADAPTSKAELKAYKQVILMNIDNTTLKSGFDTALDGYVKEGGGLLNVGGNKAYSSLGDSNATIDSLLPVRAEAYTPPVASILIIDNHENVMKSEIAIPEGLGVPAMTLTLGSALQLLSSGMGIEGQSISLTAQMRNTDYVGLMTLGSDADAGNTGYRVEFPLTRATDAAKKQFDMTLGSIASNVKTGPKTFTNVGAAISSAQTSINNVSDPIGIKNIMFISDGNFIAADGESLLDPSSYLTMVAGCIDSDIYLSGFTMGKDESKTKPETMQDMADAAGGVHMTMADFEGVTDQDSALKMFEGMFGGEGLDTKTPPYSPIIILATSPVVKDISASAIANSYKLRGINSTSVKSSATLVLEGIFDYPLYARWNVQSGKVGAFMCDLRNIEGSWSKDYISQDANESRINRRMIRQMVAELMAA